jgi:hypothetical protein
MAGLIAAGVDVRDRHRNEQRGGERAGEDHAQSLSESR